jgi:hypothetical protein
MDRYNVVFRGEFLLGYDINEAKDKLAAIFKLDGLKLEALFAGETVTVGKDVDGTKGQKIVAAAANCGVVFELEPSSQPPAADGRADSRTASPAAGEMQCPHCGTRQTRADTCLHCGKFLIEPENPTRTNKIETVSVEIDPSGGAKESSRGLFKTIRIAVLLFVLLIVALNTILSGIRATSWDSTLWVGIYPINADGSEAVDRFISRLDEDSYLPIADFFASEAERHELPLADPAKLLLAPEVQSRPPAPPMSGNPLAAMWWSLKMRWWVFRSDTFVEGPSPEVKIFVCYHPPGGGESLENSLGIRKGMFGVVNAYADFGLEPKNHVVIAHEILHTLGASDKYDPATRQPQFPEGFAEPEQSPPYPQELAEIMGARIPRTENEAVMPPSLDFTIIGDKTAREIKWSM